MTAHANSSVHMQSARMSGEAGKTVGHHAANERYIRKVSRTGEMLIELIGLARRSAPTVLVIALRIFR